MSNLVLFIVGFLIFSCSIFFLLPMVWRQLTNQGSETSSTAKYNKLKSKQFDGHSFLSSNYSQMITKKKAGMLVVFVKIRFANYRVVHSIALENRNLLRNT